MYYILLGILSFMVGFVYGVYRTLKSLKRRTLKNAKDFINVKAK